MNDTDKQKQLRSDIARLTALAMDYGEALDVKREYHIKYCNSECCCKRHQDTIEYTKKKLFDYQDHVVKRWGT